MSNEATYDFIDLTKKPSSVDIAAWIVLAKKRFGRGYISQYFDIRRLKAGFGKLNTGEYYLYRLFDKDRAAQAEFLGNGVRNFIYRRANDVKWLPIEHCKLKTARHLAEHGLPVPRSFALYHPSAQDDGLTTLTSKEALAAFLRDGASYPFFSKPLSSTISLGVVAARAYDRDSDRLLLSGNKAVEVERFVEGVSHFFDSGGYVFQEMLQPHPELERVCGRRLSTVRAMILFEDGTEPDTYRTIWKLPVGDNVADNAWRDGNLLAAVDHDTGEVTRIVAGWGTEEHEVETHPDTGQRLAGLRLPDWDRFKQLCRDAAMAFPGMRLQAWDVAMTARGPVMLELNGAGDFSLPQRATGRGLLTGRFKTFVETFK